MNEVNRPISRCPTHPGLVLHDMIYDSGLTKVGVSNIIGISRQLMQDITAAKKPITPKTAAKLGKLFGNGAYIWLQMQNNYDAWQIENSTDLSGIETLKEVNNL